VGDPLVLVVEVGWEVVGDLVLVVQLAWEVVGDPLMKLKQHWRRLMIPTNFFQVS
jgi:hypothetical protein